MGTSAVMLLSVLRMPRQLHPSELMRADRRRIVSSRGNSAKAEFEQFRLDTGMAFVAAVWAA
jgi:hypothetical protein